jgi:zinc-ribbon family
MLFYGTRSSNIKNGEIRNVTCPNCQTNVSMNYSVFGKYAHIYWIPFFPISKINIIECRSCKASYDLATVDQSIKDKFKKVQEQNPAKTPITHFSWLFIIGLLIVIGIYSSFKNDEATQEYVKNPKVGDVYRLKTSTGYYSTYKVTAVFKDSLYVFLNKMEVNNESGIDEIDVKFHKVVVG